MVKGHCLCLQVKCIVLVNCGGRLNLLELLQPESPEVQFFIVDSHRPLELDNVYNERQVTVVLREGEGQQLNVPEFDELYSSEMVRGQERVEVERAVDACSCQGEVTVICVV